MKKYILFISVVMMTLASVVSCREDALNPESVIKIDNYEKNAFDEWLEENFVNPYNIVIKYRYEQNESNINYYEIPSKVEDAIILAHLVKYLCVDTYDEVAGVNFTRGYFPKEFFFTGEWDYRNNGTIILGTAEGGKKIFLGGTNYLQRYLAQGASKLNEYYIKTIHHEFTHILNQTKDYPTDFKLVTGSGYVADSWSEAPFNSEYLQNGFISAYAQMEDGEDFAETLSIYITNTQEYWDSQIAAAGKEAGAKINAKLDIVRAYMHDSWGVDIDQLRATILRRQNDVMSGKIDLSDITLNQ